VLTVVPCKQLTNIPNDNKSGLDAVSLFFNNNTSLLSLIYFERWRK
jgi:hypothetical protein